MKHLLLLNFFIFTIFTINAQQISNEAIGSAGKTAQTNTMQLDWSIGEIVTTTVAGQDLMLTQGFLQPVKLTLLETSNASASNEIQIGVYPNPTKSFLYVNPGNFEYSGMDFKLTDVQGNNIGDFKAVKEGNVFMIDMENLRSGLYILQVSHNGILLTNQKVLKAE